MAAVTEPVQAGGAFPAHGRNAAELRAQERNEQWMLGSLAVPALLLITIVALAPIAWLFWLSFRDAEGLTANDPLPLAVSVVLPESLGTPDHLAEVTRELHDTVAAASHEL